MAHDEFGSELWDAQPVHPGAEAVTGPGSIITRLAHMAEKLNASDIHLRPRGFAALRIGGALKRVDHLPKFEATRLRDLVFTLLSDHQKEVLRQNGEVDFPLVTTEGHRMRANAYSELGKIALALRVVKRKIPELSDLGLPDIVESFAHLERGLVILTGGTGSGKSTTIAALLEVINRYYEKHIITIEDPIEYIFTPKRCIISQRELGIDLNSFAHAMRSVMREDPDVILLGEMRDRESIETALAAAETGHLVFSTVHAPSTAEVVTRICAEIPSESQEVVRAKLSQNLQAVIAQRLVPHASGKGRVLACEVLKVSARIRELILDPLGVGGITDMLRDSDIVEGIQGFDRHLLELYREGAITKQSALGHASFAVDMGLKLDGMQR